MTRRDWLLQKRARLAARLGEVDAELSGNVIESMSGHRQVLTLLEAEPTRVWTVDDMVTALVGNVSKFAVQMALSRAARDGHAEKAGHGRYRARVVRANHDGGKP